MVKNLATNARDIRDVASIPESARSPGEGNGNRVLRYSFLGYPIDRGTCLTTVHKVAQSWTRLKQLSMHNM